MAGIINMFPGGGGDEGPVSGADVIVSHSTGASGMTDHGVVTMEDGDYRLLEVKKSGTLTFDQDQLERGIRADVCLVGGGSGGSSYSSGSPNLVHRGGPGGHMYNFYDMLITSNLTMTVGAGGSAGVGGTGTNTYFGTAGGSGGASQIIKNPNDSVPNYVIPGTSNGASPTACGTGGGGNVGTPDGRSKYPFGDSSYFNIHCGGGGDGAYYGTSGPIYHKGGAGGTNGSAGSPYSTGSSLPLTGGAAGDASAGAGGGVTSTYSEGQQPGSNAHYYGGGGGAGGQTYQNSTGYEWAASSGAGYQGVIWIRIPV